MELAATSLLAFVVCERSLILIAVVVVCGYRQDFGVVWVEVRLLRNSIGFLNILSSEALPQGH